MKLMRIFYSGEFVKIKLLRATELNFIPRIYNLIQWETLTTSIASVC